MRIRSLALAGALVGLVAATTACSSSDDAASPDPKAATTTTAAALPEGVTGPITGGRYDLPYLPMPEGMAEDTGYLEDEYFLEGTATAYEVPDLGEDGAWEATPLDETADFTTRFLVRRPADASKFNGTVLVEWLNVTAGRDSDPDWGFLADLLTAEGYAYVGVSAQKTGVEPGGLGIEIPDVPKEALAPLKEWDPERYGDLHHPGDAYSYDIFTQAAAAAVDGPLAPLDPQHVIAAGESQSASRMVTYVNAIQPVSDAFDGFLIHSRGGSAGALGDDPSTQPPDVVHIRADNDTPVLQFQTETDLTRLRYAPARQDDTDHLATWEAAGTAHVDQSTLDYGVASGHRWTDVDVDLSKACGSVNDGPQPALLRAAWTALAAWVADGTPPPHSPDIATTEDGQIVRDEAGIAVDGIRTPAVDAPTAILTGDNPTDSAICSLFGSTTPLTDDQLRARYPDHDTYVAQVRASAEQAESDGFLLPADAAALVAEAEQADVPPA